MLWNFAFTQFCVPLQGMSAPLFWELREIQCVTKAWRAGESPATQPNGIYTPYLCHMNPHRLSSEVESILNKHINDSPSTLVWIQFQLLWGSFVLKSSWNLWETTEVSTEKRQHPAGSPFPCHVYLSAVSRHWLSNQQSRMWAVCLHMCLRSEVAW